MAVYNVKEIEKKWQDKWFNSDAFKAVDFDKKREKYYILSEFFGPSGKGIHIGHVKCFTPSEVMARYKRLKGYNVMYPTGWDAFGLPPENYAIKTGIHPRNLIEKNRQIFMNQLKRLGYSFDWSREINTSTPDYYKWTQWIFLQFLKNDMAYKTNGLVNFCPTCQTVLSDEDSQGGVCDRCHGAVEQVTRDVWYLRMQDYSEKMLAAIDRLDMNENLKQSQRNWIGKSIGAEVDFKLTDSSETLKVFTTRPDTLFGVTFMAVAPEHPMLTTEAKKIKNLSEIENYAKNAKYKSNLDRTANKEKTGVKIDGISAINPVNGKEIPIFVTDYVIMGYGTGAIMAVPAHDDRDYAFAKKFNIEILQVIDGPSVENEPYVGDGKLINSGFLNGLNVEKAKEKMAEDLTKNNLGNIKINYNMRDWPFNRQRYWGEPFPVVFCDKCGTIALTEKDLPLMLPDVKDYLPSPNGDSPLSKATDWVNVKCPHCKGNAKRETDTMPNWAGSSWYYLRFMDPNNEKEFVSEEKLKYWNQVDLYTGGTEHVTRHMLYASFWHNFLYDIKKVPFIDPFKKRMCNGLVLDESGKKMSKSSANGVDPIDVINEYGADVFRLHILFIGDYEKNVIWTLKGINGCQRFLDSVYSLKDMVTDEKVESKERAKLINELIKKVEEDLESFSFNTAIAAMMKYVGDVKKEGFITKTEYKALLIILNPFAPHITSEIFENLFGTDIMQEKFPVVDKSKLINETVNIPVQINGKFKFVLEIPFNETEQNVEALVKGTNKIDLNSVKKVIFVPNKIINFIM